jgi:hypothetical protein
LLSFKSLAFLGFMAFYLAFKLTLGSSIRAPAMISRREFLKLALDSTAHR